MTFYTYMCLRRVVATPYYVGKGSGKRVCDKRRSVCLPTAPDGSVDRARILIQYWADEATAFEMEKYYIRLFGRKDNGTGILRNLTDGGEGVSGVVRSEEFCRLVAERNKGNKYGCGAVSEETRCRMRAAAHNRTTEHLQKIGAASKGRQQSEEARQRTLDAVLNRLADVEFRKRMSTAQLKAQGTPEARAKNSAAQKARWARQKAVVCV